jgi:hypothetical protein
MPQRTIYALLVGIDTYEPPVPPLRGCVNDVETFAAYLRGRGDGDLRLEVLKNEGATRERVITGFRDHLGRAGPDDVALFYFSGHGSQEHAHRAFWPVEPDRLNETLVLYDSRSDGGRDLADKELAKLLHEVATSNPHVVVVLDCCHSGSGTRDAAAADTAVRLADVDRRERPLETFEPVFTRAELQDLATRLDAGVTEHHGFFSLPEGRHVLLAACRSRQLAKEYRVDGQRHHGAFSHFLWRVLTTSNRQLSYRDLFARARVQVETNVLDQSPVVEASTASDLDLAFLGGAVTERTGYLVFARGGDWMLDAGAVHGLAGPRGGETTRFAVFDAGAAGDDLLLLDRSVSEAEVAEVLPHESRLVVRGSPLDTSRHYQAVLIAAPTPTMTVHVSGDDEGVRAVREALATSAPAGRPSMFVREADGDEAPTYRLLARDGAYLIKRPADDRAIVEPVGGGYGAGTAREVARQLEHIGRWHDIVHLENVGSTIEPSAVEMRLHHDGRVVDASSADAETLLGYRYEDGAWHRPTFRLQVENTTDERLYCAVVALFEDFTVEPGLFPEGCVELPPRSDAWAVRGGDIPASVPDALWRAGVTERRDILKLIVSTTPFDARLLQQGGLREPVRATRNLDATARGGGGNVLNRLMARVRTRAYDLHDVQTLNDWTATSLTTRVVRPQEAVPTRRGGELTPAGGVRVVVEPHPALEAHARLGTLTALSRDMGRAHASHDLIPQVFVGEPEVTRPVSFTTTRGIDPGLGVLELTDVANAQAVTSDQPLVLTIDIPLQGDEHLLAYAHDGEFFLPLGYATPGDGSSRGLQAQARVVLDRLPEPDALRARSLSGAIRILFQKFFSKPLGREFPYPMLRRAGVGADGTVDYLDDLPTLRAAVEGAARILLFVHGIIGSTDALVPSLRLATFTRDGRERPLEDAYDLVLAFDYESLHTPIGDNARLLKARLDAIGLGENHGKTLDVVVHSMGGLVARWFVEREGGRAVVSHLVMLGTPNAGSPWAGIQDWATAAAAIGLNGLSATFWPARILAGLVTLIEKVDVNLDSMHTESAFIRELAASPDPGVRYTVVAGSTSLRADASRPGPGESASLVERLMGRLRLRDTFHDALTKHVFGAPNDIAVSVQSVMGITRDRRPPPAFEEVASDHLSYFRTEAGLTVMVRALLDPGTAGDGGGGGSGGPARAFGVPGGRERLYESVGPDPHDLEHADPPLTASEPDDGHGATAAAGPPDDEALDLGPARSRRSVTSAPTPATTPTPRGSVPGDPPQPGARVTQLTRFPNVECPRTVVMARRFTLHVELLIEAATPDAAPLIVDDVGGPGAPPPEVEVVVRAPAFHIEGHDTQVMAVLRDEDADVRFLLTPVALGDQPIRVDFYQHGRRVGTSRRTVLVAESVAIAPEPRDDGPKDEPRDLTARPVIGPPDLELCATLDPSDGRTIRFTLHSTKASIDYHHTGVGQILLPASPSEKMSALYREIGALADRRRKRREIHVDHPDGGTPANGEYDKRRLDTFGNDLWDELVPPQLQHEYWRFRDNVASLLVTSDEPWIPWEMIKPYRYVNDVRQEDDFWCRRFAMARWLSGPSPADTFVMRSAQPVTPEFVDLAAVSSELEFIQSLSTLDTAIERLPPLHDRLKVLDWIEAGDFSILHFACHGAFDSTLPDESSIVLSGGKLRASDIRGRFVSPRMRPLVFINACHGARLEQSFTGLGGWADRFISARAGAFIGTMWEVDDALALQFAERFYTELIVERASLATAFQVARDEIRQAAPDNSTWLAYVLYADPEARVQGPLPAGSGG